MKYAAMCSIMQEYAQMSKTKICNMCILSINMLKCAKTKYAHVCKYPICINMHKICTNMQNKICINMYVQNMHK